MRKKTEVNEFRTIGKEAETKYIDIPKDGFLGLLAYGDIGIVAWRKARGYTIKSAEQIQEEKKKRENE
ncbi:hypothetical protein SDC9_53427 [bioreactor metagenome]|uniref:Uncharacterized protein n=1 Tax=bioreactor metagenome TaxID=1076179 RepID=A0A644WU71_9ZZZZ